MATGYPIMEYLRRRRMAQAARALLEGGQVLQVALDLQYESAEGLSRAFRRVYGCSPSAFGRAEVPVVHCEKLVLWESPGGRDSEWELGRVKLGRRELVGVSLPSAGENPLFIMLLWVRLCGLVQNTGGVVNPYLRYGLWLRSSGRPGHHSYFAGLEVKAGSRTPQGMERALIPAGSYVSLTHRGNMAMHRVQCSYDKLRGWMKENRLRYRLAEPVVEVYDTRQDLRYSYETAIYEPIEGGH